MNTSNGKDGGQTGSPRQPSPFWVSKRGSEDGVNQNRIERIRVATLEAMERRRTHTAPARPPDKPIDPSNPDSLPFTAPPGLLPPEIRRRLQGDHMPQVTPALMRQLYWQAGILMTLKRLIIYSVAAVRWGGHVLWDKIWRQDTLDRRAIRLREAIQRIGGTAVKLGQQMAMRIDLLPYEYTVELSKMLDRMTSFPSEYAIKRLEKQFGKPLLEIFAAFDPKPIGSASISCVFQAYLKTGERVAVKVRRPDIGVHFAADCNALGWVLQLLEFLTVIRPGLSRNFLFEFRHMLMEELDFVKEARYTELFRAGVKEHLPDVSAPRVYFDYSCSDIMVTEFLSGVWLRELIVAVENEDEEALAALRSQGIHPELVAQRLLRTNQYGVFESVLFHADPHPSNVVVQKDSRLIFIDFGSSGAYTTKERNNWRQLSYYHDKADIGRMVQSALAILEPLPPIDVDEFSMRVEMIFWQDLYAFRSEHSEWWEHTSAKIWIQFLRLAREYNVPLNLNTLKMIRSTLMYETIAARLYPQIDAYREHRVYNKMAGKRARKRVHKAALKFLFQGPGDEAYLTIEQLGDMVNRTMYLGQRLLDAPPFQFSSLVDKASNAISTFLRGVLQFSFTTLLLALTLLTWRFAHGFQLELINIWDAARDVLTWPVYQFFLALKLFLDIRKVMFRFYDKDVSRQRN